jgi:hypothetical protein
MLHLKSVLAKTARSIRLSVKTGGTKVPTEKHTGKDGKKTTSATRHPEKRNEIKANERCKINR